MKHASSRIGALASALALVACGHSARTEKMRSALDAGNLGAAVASLNEELEVKSDNDLPKSMGNEALFVLDRGSIQQARAKFALSKQDLQAADKAIEVLDVSRNAADSIGKYIFSDSSGRYKAPPYEKLMINTLNLVNYLESRDLSGALVEARRLAVMQKYYRENRQKGDSPILALGGFLAGLAYEKSGNADEALRYYDDALAVSDMSALDVPIARLFKKSSYRSPRLEAHAARAAASPTPSPTGEPDGAMPAPETAEIIVVVGYGRVPHKIANRMPIGLALTAFSGAIHPNDVGAANRLAGQGLVTWINYPSLAEIPEPNETPVIRIDGQALPVDDAVSVTQEVKREWHNIEGSVVASAITRLIARYAAGEVARAATGDRNGLGMLASLVVQGTLSATDVPDTRSWETLPARVGVVRTQVAPGRHTVQLGSRGVSRSTTVQLGSGSWLFVSLQALR